MAPLQTMPPIAIAPIALLRFGEVWLANGDNLSRTPPYSSANLCGLFDEVVARSLATLLGDIPISIPSRTALGPALADCVELGPMRSIGGARPQNFDVGYRPDGTRVAFDSKSLNDRESVGKNWQNMINDLATEATTVHTRFPQAVVAFMVILPLPCLTASNQAAIIATLERLTGRRQSNDPPHLAEAISLVLWNPDTGEISPAAPAPPSPLRLERFSEQVEASYRNRYKGLPPHAE